MCRHVGAILEDERLKQIHEIQFIPALDVEYDLIINEKTRLLMRGSTPKRSMAKTLEFRWNFEISSNHRPGERHPQICAFPNMLMYSRSSKLTRYNNSIEARMPRTVLSPLKGNLDPGSPSSTNHQVMDFFLIHSFSTLARYTI